MKTNILKNETLRFCFPYLIIIFGSAVVAFGLAGFLVPHRIVAGGTSGLATILFHLTHFPIGVAAILLDLPLFLWSFYRFGFGFMGKTFFAAVFLALFLQIFNQLISEPLSDDVLLSSVYGGIITGGGMGLIFKYGATTGGIDLIASMFRYYFGWKLGTGLFLADGIIIALSGVFFSVDLILYGILTVFIGSRTVDLLQTGASAGKGIFIMTSYPQEVKEAIYEKVNRGVTVFYGEGGYQGKEQKILYSVVSQKEVRLLKDAVTEIDKEAFLVVTSTKEVLGEGFYRSDIS